MSFLMNILRPMRAPFRQAIAGARRPIRGRAGSSADSGLARPEVPDSDRRVRGGVVKACAVCLKTKPLCLGHVAPKWMYEWIKNEGAGRLHGNYESLGIFGHRGGQDGTKHYLLCGDCEQVLGAAENYGRGLMVGGSRAWRSLGVRREGDHLLGVDSDRVRRMVYGIALKAHFATGAPFHRIRFSDAQVVALRDGISGSLAEEALPVLVTEYVTRVPGADTRALLYPTRYPGPADDAIAFSLLAGGWEWFIFFDLEQVPGHLAPGLFSMRLRRGQPWPAPVRDIVDHPFLRRMLRTA